MVGEIVTNNIYEKFSDNECANFDPNWTKKLEVSITNIISFYNQLYPLESYN